MMVEKKEQHSEITISIMEKLVTVCEMLAVILTKQSSSSKKSTLEILIALTPLLSGVVVGGAVAIATILYNSGQLEIARFAALDKYRGYLSSNNPQERQFGYEAFVAFGQEEFVARLIAARRDSAGTKVLEGLIERGESEVVRETAKKALLNLPQERRIYSLINIFETGNTDPNFSRTYSVGDDLKYGLFSLKAGTLETLVKRYINSPDANYSAELSAYLARLTERDSSLVSDDRFKALLVKVGSDPAMSRSHFQFFREVYFSRAYREAVKLDVNTPLGIAVIYDSLVHGNWPRLRNKTNEMLNGSPADGISEKEWIVQYLKNRINWLDNHRYKVIQKTSWRPKAFFELAEYGNWNLLPPIKIKNIVINE
jgi:chitosanase